MRGHKKEFCGFCPMQKCSITSIPCTCLQCNKSTNIVSTNNSSSKHFHSSTQIGTVNEVILDKSISQSSLAGYNGSNACTIISVLTTMHFQLQDIDTSSKEQTAEQYANIIKTGNALYHIIPKTKHQVNLYVEEVLEHSFFSGYMSSAGCSFLMATKDLAECVKERKNSLYILICPPDKSMAICTNDDTIFLFDSHQHQNGGALLTTCPLADVEAFAQYVDDMVTRDWRSTLIGANFIEIIC